MTHPRNRHGGRYDFDRLVAASPELSSFIVVKHGERTLDFARPEAVQALNRALLSDFYGVKEWKIPPGYLCPPVPGRADYVHAVADLLAEGRREGSRGASIRMLDVGVGASCIYPLIGHGEYGWSFVGSDIDAQALESAERIARANPALPVEFRLQASPAQIFSGVVRPADRFAASFCNPPFHASAEDAARSSSLKWKKLGRSVPRKHSGEAHRNFGGQPGELWCPGGEQAFIERMMKESVHFAAQIGWFTTLVSKGSTLTALERAIERIGARDARLIPMEQGQKQSRVVAWTFKD